MLFHTLILIPWISSICFGKEENKFLKFHRLNDLTSHQYEQIFEPNYDDHARTTTKGHIELTDEFGQFMNLSYHSKHPTNVNILKLDETHHTNRVHSLLCSLDHDQNEMIQLNFTSKSTAKQYYKEIQRSIYHPQKKHLITGGQKWHCNSQLILKQITQIQRNDAVLTLYTQDATLLDIFETLSISYSTNVEHNPYKYKRAYTSAPDGVYPRRLTNFWGTLWSDAIHGLQEIIHFIRGIIEDMVVPTIRGYVLNDPIHYGPTVGTKEWGWNYDNEQRDATQKEMEFAENVSCVHCFARMDVTYTYQLNITDRELHYLLLTLEGDMEISAGIRVDGGIRDNEEYRENTKDIRIFGFAVAGIVFGADLYGQIGAAIYGTLTDFSFNVAVSGRIKKGIEFVKNYQTNSNAYHYINQHSLIYDEPEPKSRPEQGKLTGYIRPTIYLALNPIGNMYFGLQPTFDFELRAGHDDNCIVHWTPKVKTIQFIGAELNIADWKKTVDFGHKQTNLHNIAGCVDKSELLQNQVSVNDDVTGTNTSNVTYIDYSNIEVIPRSSSSNTYWGNWSTIYTLCDDYAVLCGDLDGDNTAPTPPHYGSLFMLKSLDNDTWIGIYRTKIQLVYVHMNGIWNKVWNVSCIARHQFELIMNHDGRYDGEVVDYKVSLLEWYCDTEDVYLGLNKTASPSEYAAWLCLISLPDKMSGIVSDPSFGTMMVFDPTNWCHVFTLNSRTEYRLPKWTAKHVAEYVDPLFYGIWDCPNMLNGRDKHLKLYFISYNATTTETEAILHYGMLNRTLYFKGHIDLNRMEMDLRAIHMNISLDFVGFVRILSDGSIIYSGSVQHEKCTGFVFHGSFNLTKFEEDKISMDSDDSQPKSKSTSMSTLVIVVICCIGIAIVVMVYKLWRNKRLLSHSYALMDDSGL